MGLCMYLVSKYTCSAYILPITLKLSANSFYIYISSVHLGFAIQLQQAPFNSY